MAFPENLQPWAHAFLNEYSVPRLIQEDPSVDCGQTVQDILFKQLAFRQLQGEDSTLRITNPKLFLTEEQDEELVAWVTTNLSKGWNEFLEDFFTSHTPTQLKRYLAGIQEVFPAFYEAIRSNINIDEL